MIDQVELTKELQAGLVARARKDGFLVYDAGSVGGETNGIAWEVHLYTDQACARCHHTACPRCERWCDVLIRTRDEDGDEDIDLCCDGRCSYAATSRFFTADGAPWPSDANETGDAS